MSDYRAKHQPCACGCGELADECMSGRGNPLAAFTLDPTPLTAAQVAERYPRLAAGKAQRQRISPDKGLKK